MEQDKILRLFKKFTGDEIDLYGLKCIPIRVGEEVISKKHNKPYYQIQFKIENPNKISYYYSIVEEELLDIVQEFGEYVNHKFVPEVIWNDRPKLYLNDEVRNKIQKVFDSVREIKFTTGTPFVGYKRYLIEINSIGLSPTYFDEESYYIRNSVVPISATLNGENIDVIEAIDIYTEEYLPQKETYYETEGYYQGVDQVINQYPLLNEIYVLTYYDTKFIL